MAVTPDLHQSARAAYVGFGVFGAFWGTWGACLPAIRDGAGVTDGQLGTALVFVGLGALSAMPLTGPAVDRWGSRVAGSLLPCLGAVGVLVAIVGRDVASLCLAMTAVGAASGGADVAINTAAGVAERSSGRPVVTRAHGVFSVAVVASGLGAGALRDRGFTPILPFLLVAVATVVAAALVRTAGVDPPSVRPASAERRWPRRRAHRSSPGPSPTARDARPDPRRTPDALRRLRSARRRVSNAVRARRTLLGIGVLGALAFAVENAHQSWSAIYLADVHDAGPALGAAGPATFAAVVALSRFGLGAAGRTRPTPILVTGSTAAAIGSATLATSDSVATALVGLALAAAGTGVLYPTLISLVTVRVDDAFRGAATATVATVAYLGFLAGPAYVGGWAQLVGVPGAMVAVAAIAVALGLLVPPLLGRSGWARTVRAPERSDDEVTVGRCQVELTSCTRSTIRCSTSGSESGNTP